jgi:hypothetical protein
MSRSQNTELINPSKKFIEWKSDKKAFQYYDKEKEENVEVKLPVRFLVLDTLSTIKGFSDTDQSGFWSNEVRDIKIEPFTVRTKKGECAKGLYENIMGGRDMTGAKYYQSVYAMIKEGKEFIMVNFQIGGSALGQWIEFRKKNKIYEGAIEVETTIEGTKGKTIYNMPVFTKISTTPESDEQAKKMDAELQEYLTAYFKKNHTVVETETISKVTKGDAPDPI